MSSPIPHQANKTMIVDLAAKAGSSADQLYFNIWSMGNVSATSIPVAILTPSATAPRPPLKDLRSGFRAGVVGGYAVVRIDPAIVADEVVLDLVETPHTAPAKRAPTTTYDVRVAFGEWHFGSRGGPAQERAGGSARLHRRCRGAGLGWRVGDGSMRPCQLVPAVTQWTRSASFGMTTYLNGAASPLWHRPRAGWSRAWNESWNETMGT